MRENESLHTIADIENANRRVAAVAPLGDGQYAGASLARTLWHAFYDLTSSELAIDFYLGEEPEAGAILRSEQLRFKLGNPSQVDQ